MSFNLTDEQAEAILAANIRSHSQVRARKMNSDRRQHERFGTSGRASYRGISVPLKLQVILILLLVAVSILSLMSGQMAYVQARLPKSWPPACFLCSTTGRQHWNRSSSMSGCLAFWQDF